MIRADERSFTLPVSLQGCEGRSSSPGMLACSSLYVRGSVPIIAKIYSTIYPLALCGQCRSNRGWYHVALLLPTTEHGDKRIEYISFLWVGGVRVG